MAFSTRISVAFGDTDPAGLVYYPNLFHYCHVAMERFLAERCGIAYHNLIAEQRIGFPTVKIDTEFAKPILYGDEVEVLIDVLTVGRRSLTLRYQIIRVKDVVQCAKSTMVHVAMNLDTRTSTDIPDSLRQMLKEARPSQ